MKKVAYAGVMIHRMRGGTQEEPEQGESYENNFDGQSYSSERGLFVRDKSKGGSSSASQDIMGNRIPTPSCPQRFSVPAVSGTHPPYQGPFSGSSPWSPAPSQDNTSTSSQTLYSNGAYGSRPSQDQMRHNSAPVVPGSGQQIGGHWMPGHQTQIYAEPATMNNQSGYVQSSAENPYAQQDPRSVSVGPYHAQQGAGQGNYSLQPGRDSYSGASYQASLCYHSIPYHQCSECRYRNPNPY